MKKRPHNIIIILLTGLFALSGCAGFQIRPHQTKLDQWLHEIAIPSIIENLKQNSYMKNRPFIIVKADGDNVDYMIDDLTKENRNTITSSLLGENGIQLVRRQPVRQIYQPYEVAELPCDNSREFKMLITIDIKQSRGNTALINIRAIDVETSNWISGFSLHTTLVLTDAHRNSLSKLNPDEHLRGLEFLPFKWSQRDVLSSYLAQNLSCLLRNEADSGIKVYVNEQSLSKPFTVLLELLKHDLSLCHEIKIIDNHEDAELIIEAKTFDIGGKNKIYVVCKDRSNNSTVLSSSAFFQSLEQPGFNISVEFDTDQHGVPVIDDPDGYTTEAGRKMAIAIMERMQKQKSMSQQIEDIINMSINNSAGSLTNLLVLKLSASALGPYFKGNDIQLKIQVESFNLVTDEISYRLSCDALDPIKEIETTLNLNEKNSISVATDLYIEPILSAFSSLPIADFFRQNSIYTDCGRTEVKKY